MPRPAAVVSLSASLSCKCVGQLTVINARTGHLLTLSLKSKVAVPLVGLCDAVLSCIAICGNRSGYHISCGDENCRFHTQGKSSHHLADWDSKLGSCVTLTNADESLSTGVLSWVMATRA
ncbi:hypothetical protein HanRHA438_Chr17g0831121 [Helianthus annuus]|nr:hypothetical protein HanRHA438_Chr17g0831121 [Helianthus annuus]